jgi:hypothetical protein
MVRFSLGKKSPEVLVNLSQFPENRDKQNCDYKQQELENHFYPSVQKVQNVKVIPLPPRRARRMFPAVNFWPQSRLPPTLLYIQ